MQKATIKTKEEIEIMRKAGRILAEVLIELKEMCKPGLDCFELEKRFLELCDENKVNPSCKGYAPMGFKPFPTGLCLSLNEQSVHNIPKQGVKLQEGDLVTLDTVIELHGLHVDHAISFGIDPVSKNVQQLIDVTKEALDRSVSKVKPGKKVGVISNTMQKVVENAGFSVLEDYAGHGIGKEMHEPPEIPCYGNKYFGPKLKAGMTLAIEPLVCEKSNILEHEDVWYTKTTDGGYFCQFEHTVLVTDKGYEILTST